MFIGPVFDSEGDLIYHFGSQVDGTARREVEEARIRAQRMDTLGSMAALIAHEFNNLMTVVVGNIENVAKDPLSPRQIERLSRVGWAARAAGRLTQQMLSFAGRHLLRKQLDGEHRAKGRSAALAAPYVAWPGTPLRLATELVKTTRS